MEFVAQLGLLALGSRMKALSERLYALADAVYARQGVGIQGRWFPILRLLHDRGPGTVGEIAEAIGQTHSAVSQMADKLMREGLLRVTLDRHDKRVRRLRLSDSAEAALRQAKPAWRAIDEVLSQRCQAAGIDLLADLEKLAALLDDSLLDDIGARCLAIQRGMLRIVPFTAERRDHFYRLNAAWLQKYFYLEEIDHRVLSNPEQEILAHNGTIMFALLDDQVVGTCALVEAEKGVFELTKMAVDERYQGLGIGRKLIDAIVSAFQEKRGKTLFLETNNKLVPAVRLYESSGFEHQPIRKPDSHYQRSNVYMIWRAPKRERGKRAGSASG